MTREGKTLSVVYEREATIHKLFGYTENGWVQMFAFDSDPAYSHWKKQSWQPATKAEIIKPPINAAPVDKFDRPNVLQWRHIDPKNIFSDFKM